SLSFSVSPMGDRIHQLSQLIPASIGKSMQFIVGLVPPAAILNSPNTPYIQQSQKAAIAGVTALVDFGHASSYESIDAEIKSNPYLQEIFPDEPIAPNKVIDGSNVMYAVILMPSFDVPNS